MINYTILWYRMHTGHIVSSSHLHLDLGPAPCQIPRVIMVHRSPYCCVLYSTCEFFIVLHHAKQSWSGWLVVTPLLCAVCCVLQGVANMIAVAKESGGVKHLVLVSSMLTDPANR